MVGKPYLGITSCLPVIRPESGATLSGALESRTDDPKDFIRRGGWPWDRAAPRGALIVGLVLLRGFVRGV